MVLKLKQKLKLCCEVNENTVSLSTDKTKKQLLQHLNDMKQLLPDDLNTILNNT